LGIRVKSDGKERRRTDFSDRHEEGEEIAPSDPVTLQNWTSSNLHSSTATDNSNIESYCDMSVDDDGWYCLTAACS